VPRKIIKKSFTLFEMIIVVGLIFVIYYFSFTFFKINDTKINKLTMINLKHTLLKYDFDNNISLKCVDDDKINCYIVIDKIVQKNKILNLFEKCPDVYSYSKELSRIDFKDIKLQYFTKPVCFKFEIKHNLSSSQIIVDTGKKIYLYDGISLEPQVVKSLYDINDYFENKINEVKNAF
jgi:hypothetical protein